MATPPLKAIDARGATLALVLSILWGANPVAIKLGLEDIPPVRLALMRFVVGGVVIVLWGWGTGRLRGFSIARSEWWPLLVVGFLFTLQIVSMNVATALTSAAHATVLLNLYAVHTVVLAHFLIPGDRLTVRGLAGVLIAYAGILLLFPGQVGTTTSTWLGDLIMFASGVVLAERTVYLARAVHQLDGIKLLLAQAIMGIAAFAVVSALFESEPTRWTWRLAGSIAYQGVIIAGFNFVVNLWLLGRYRPSVLSTIFLTQPIFGVIAASLVAGDRLTADLVLASLAVAAGIGLTIQGAGSRAAPARTEPPSSPTTTDTDTPSDRDRTV
jgi:drug/metabolite transporter (DMT)-like permease